MTDSAKNYIELLTKTIKQFPKLIIYGAGDFGKKFADFSLQQTDFPELSFAVTKSDNERSDYKGIKIEGIDELLQERNKALVIIATRESVQESIRKELVRRDFENVIGLHSEKFQDYYWTLNV